MAHSRAGGADMARNIKGLPSSSFAPAQVPNYLPADSLEEALESLPPILRNLVKPGNKHTGEGIWRRHPEGQREIHPSGAVTDRPSVRDSFKHGPLGETHVPPSLFAKDTKEDSPRKMGRQGVHKIPLREWHPQLLDPVKKGVDDIMEIEVRETAKIRKNRKDKFREQHHEDFNSLAQLMAENRSRYARAKIKPVISRKKSEAIGPPLRNSKRGTGARKLRQPLYVPPPEEELRHADIGTQELRFEITNVMRPKPRVEDAVESEEDDEDETRDTVPPPKELKLDITIEGDIDRISEKLDAELKPIKKRYARMLKNLLAETGRTIQDTTIPVDAHSDLVTLQAKNVSSQHQCFLSAFKEFIAIEARESPKKAEFLMRMHDFYNENMSRSLASLQEVAFRAEVLEGESGALKEAAADDPQKKETEEIIRKRIDDIKRDLMEARKTETAFMTEYADQYSTTMGTIAEAEASMKVPSMSAKENREQVIAKSASALQAKFNDALKSFRMSRNAYDMMLFSQNRKVVTLVKENVQLHQSLEKWEQKTADLISQGKGLRTGIQKLRQHLIDILLEKKDPSSVMPDVVGNSTIDEENASQTQIEERQGLMRMVALGHIKKELATGINSLDTAERDANMMLDEWIGVVLPEKKRLEISRLGGDEKAKMAILEEYAPEIVSTASKEQLKRVDSLSGFLRQKASLQDVVVEQDELPKPSPKKALVFNFEVPEDASPRDGQERMPGAMMPSGSPKRSPLPPKNVNKADSDDDDDVDMDTGGPAKVAPAKPLATRPGVKPPEEPPKPQKKTPKRKKEIAGAEPIRPPVPTREVVDAIVSEHRTKSQTAKKPFPPKGSPRGKNAPRLNGERGPKKDSKAPILQDEHDLHPGPW